MEEIIINELGHQLDLIQSSIEWAERYNKSSFPKEDFKYYRRTTKRIKHALGNRCSIAAYGESQVGKSYLISSLLSSPSAPFVIVNQGKEYNFITDLNSSGGNLQEVETTGLITRFTLQEGNDKMRDFIHVDNLSVSDIIMVLLDTYYRDINIDLETSLQTSKINERLATVLSKTGNKGVQSYIDEDDIRDMEDYLEKVSGGKAQNVLNSNFFDIVSSNINRLEIGMWEDTFKLLWNENTQMTSLFGNLIREYSKISFTTEVYIPFDAVLRHKGTILKIQWLDLVGGKSGSIDRDDVVTVDVYDATGNLLAKDFGKEYLSSVAAEVTFVLPNTIALERNFLNDIDLLDFPGARSRLDEPESKIQEKGLIPEMLRRGKVAYLFNKYVRDRKISSILFCHHHSMKKSDVANTITNWVEDVIGKSPQERALSIQATDNVSPLFMVATKFNIDLAKVGEDSSGHLSNHWKRFTEVIPEMIKDTWFEKWSAMAGTVQPFQNIFPLRDFYWSGCKQGGMSHLFDGYSDGKDEPKSDETHEHQQPGYPNYFKDLRDSFINQQFVRRHFLNPEQTWNEVATPNNDGSKPIIKAIDRISRKLDSAREVHYLSEIKEIKDKIEKTLAVYYEPDDDDAKLEKTRLITKRIRARLLMSVGENPAIFGRIIDSLMIEPREFRKIAHDIIVLKTDVPKDFPAIKWLRAIIGIDPKDGKDVNLQKLIDYYGSEDAMNEEFKGKNYTVDDVISGNQEFCTTVADVVTMHIMNCWMEFLNKSINSLDHYLPYPEDIVLSIQTLVSKLKVKEKITRKISQYETMFSTNELLNAIADYASLELNRFISTVGRREMSEDNIKEIGEKAKRCSIDVDLSPNGIESVHMKQPLEDVLNALDQSALLLKKAAFEESDIMTLRRLPLWDNYIRWQNLLIVGMILASGVSTKDPRANEEVKSIIDQVEQLYS